MTTTAVPAAWAADAGAGAAPGGAHACLVPQPPTDRVAGWLWPLAVTLVAGVLRFVRLGEPRTLVFDETYYAKDAFALLRYGYEHQFVDKANERLLAGDTNVFTGGGSFVVHPPAGKWVIAVGEWLFGMTPFGWRFMTALLGTLAVLVLARTTRRMTGSTLLGSTAGLLLAVDGLSLVESRTALLDPLLAFWVLAAFGCLVVDRDRARARLAALGDGTGPGPRLGGRPWRVAAGVCLGLAVATKWSGAWYAAAFPVLALLWDVGARRSLGVRRPLRGVLRRDLPPAALTLGLLPVGVYLASWTGWLATSGGWGRQWAAGQATSWPFVPAALRSLWHYHAEMLRFNVNLREPHPYQSNPWGWLVMARPTSFFYETPPAGSPGCPVAPCSREVLALGTPLLWWGAALTLAVVVWLWLGRRDWRAGAALAGLAAGWLPWFAFQDRTIFTFYAVVFAPFLVLGVTLVLGLVLGPPEAGPRRRRVGALLGGSYVLAVVLDFLWLAPVYLAETLPYGQWLARMWLRTWV